NTYSNYQEATRTFWRQTVLPLVSRTAKALSAWLSPAYHAVLELRPDLDAVATGITFGSPAGDSEASLRHHRADVRCRRSRQFARAAVRRRLVRRVLQVAAGRLRLGHAAV